MTETTGSLLHLDHELYDRLFEQRTILLGEPLEDLNTNRLCNALLVLSATDAKADIRFLINSPGGRAGHARHPRPDARDPQRRGKPAHRTHARAVAGGHRA